MKAKFVNEENFVRNLDPFDALKIGIQKNIEIEFYRDINYLGDFPLTEEEIKRIYNITIKDNPENKTFILRGLRSNIEDYIEDYNLTRYFEPEDYY